MSLVDVMSSVLNQDLLLEQNKKLLQRASTVLRLLIESFTSSESISFPCNFNTTLIELSNNAPDFVDNILLPVISCIGSMKSFHDFCFGFFREALTECSEKILKPILQCMTNCISKKDLHVAYTAQEFHPIHLKCLFLEVFALLLPNLPQVLSFDQLGQRALIVTHGFQELPVATPPCSLFGIHVPEFRRQEIRFESLFLGLS
jgi:hypothetical protein